MSGLPTVPLEVGGRTFQALDLDHPRVQGRITEEVRAGVPVYYDRRWALTGTFCRLLVERPELVAGGRILVAGAGVGLEAVVVGTLADRVVVNDLAPVSLELAAEQLRANGVEGFEVDEGPFQDAELAGVDGVVACFVVYDRATREAMTTLLERAAARGVPALLANEDIGGHFRAVLEDAPAPVAELAELEKGRIVRVG